MAIFALMRLFYIILQLQTDLFPILRQMPRKQGKKILHWWLVLTVFEVVWLDAVAVVVVMNKVDVVLTIVVYSVLTTDMILHIVKIMARIISTLPEEERGQEMFVL